MIKDNKNTLKNSLIIGAAIFSMFFGAGNMIFPPYLGLKAGTEWFSGFLGYYIADIGLALLAILAQVKYGGYKKIFAPIGNFFSNAIMLVIILCIGPIISIPRTAATTYELSILPLADNFNMLLFYIIFFAIILFLCIKKSAVVDIVGKILTPLLFLGLIALIIIGIINPLGTINMEPRVSNVIGEGIEAGYQSMDVLAAIIFGVLIFNSVIEKGHTEPKEKSKVSINASLIAGIGLLIVYLGLTFLGASASGGYDLHVGRSEFLISIINRLIPGNLGLIFFGVIVGLACVSTAIALTSSAAEYISNLTNNKISYKCMVILISVFGAIISCMGVEGLVKLASPLLNIVYPPVLTLIIMSFLSDKLNLWSYRFATISAFVISLITTLSPYIPMFRFIKNLPLSSFGLGWLIPTFLFAITGVFIRDKKI